MKPGDLLSSLVRALAAIAAVGVTALDPVSPAFAQTRVEPPKGRHITITVPIDARVGDDKEGARIANIWKASAENYWNAAFNGPENPYRGCIDLELKVNVRPIRYDAEPQLDRHLINLLTGPVGAFDSSGEIIYEGPRKIPCPTHQDCLNPYKNADSGYFTLRFNDPAQANHVAHEVGHLLGLADDYDPDPVASAKEKKRVTKPLNDRKHTLMADGGRVDRDLIVRLVKLIRMVGHEVPDCKKACLPPDSSTFARMQWGKWSGKIEKKGEGGSYFSTGVDCYGGGKNPLCEPARQHGGSWWEHGTSNAVATVEFFTVFADDLESVLSGTPTPQERAGKVHLSPTHVRIVGQEKSQYENTFRDGTGGPGGSSTKPYDPNIGDPFKDCPDVTISGHEGPTTSGKMGYFETYSVHEVSWNYSLVGQEKPRHVVMVEKLPNFDYDGGVVYRWKDRYGKQAREIVDAVFSHLQKQRQYRETGTVSGISETLQNTFRDPPAWPRLEDAWNKIRRHYDEARNLWSGRNPADAMKYQSELEKLETAKNEYIRAIHSLEGELTAAVESAAVKLKAERLDGNAVGRLQALEQEMRDNGIEKFAANASRGTSGSSAKPGFSGGKNND